MEFRFPLLSPGSPSPGRLPLAGCGWRLPYWTEGKWRLREKSPKARQKVKEGSEMDHSIGCSWKPTCHPPDGKQRERETEVVWICVCAHEGICMCTCVCSWGFCACVCMCVRACALQGLPGPPSWHLRNHSPYLPFFTLAGLWVSAALLL